MRYIQTKVDDLRPGMQVKIVEKFKNGEAITYEGELKKVLLPLVRFDYSSAWVTTEEDERLAGVEVYRVLPPLPTTLGSVIRVPGQRTKHPYVLMRRKLSSNQFDLGDLVWQNVTHPEDYFTVEGSHGYESFGPSRAILATAEILFDARVQ